MLLIALLVSAQLATVAVGSGKTSSSVVPQGSTSHVEDAALFRLYYGQSFKVIKNSVDGRSYLLMQNNSTMASRTKYCSGRIKSFVIPLLNYSVDPTFFPVSFFELLGLVDGLKGITSESISSQCVLKSYANGNIQLINKTDPRQFTSFSAHFMSNADNEQACNFAAFVPLEEKTPLQRAEWIKYLAAFTNSEARANSIYGAIKGNYICLSKAAANLTNHFKPIVAWVEYSQDIWTFSSEDYKLRVTLFATLKAFTFNQGFVWLRDIGIGTHSGGRQFGGGVVMHVPSHSTGKTRAKIPFLILIQNAIEKANSYTAASRL